MAYLSHNGIIFWKKNIFFKQNMCFAFLYNFHMQILHSVNSVRHVHKHARSSCKVTDFFFWF